LAAVSVEEAKLSAASTAAVYGAPAFPIVGGQQPLFDASWSNGFAIRLTLLADSPALASPRVSAAAVAPSAFTVTSSVESPLAAGAASCAPERLRPLRSFTIFATDAAAPP